jgi:hypothetical protein
MPSGPSRAGAVEAVLASVWFVAMVLGSCASAQQSHEPTTVSVCDVLAAPDEYHGRVTSLRGTITTDYFEYSGIEDSRCPDRVISLGPENLVESGQPALRMSLASVRGNERAHVEATATGVIEWRPGEVPFLVILSRRYSDIEVVEED